MSRMFRVGSCVFALTLVALCGSAARAQVMTFDNSCGTGLWSSSCTSFVPPDSCFCSNNWSTGTTVTPTCSPCPASPGTGTDAVIGGIFVENDTFADIRSLTTATTFQNTSGILVSVGASYHGPVSATGYFGGTGVHDFHGPFTSEAALGASLNWPARVHFYGGVDIVPGGSLGVYTETFNHAMCTWRSSGTEAFLIDASSGGELAIFRNMPGATLLASGDGWMRGIISVGHLENRGTLRKDGGLGVTTLAVEFKNRPGAVIDVRTGHLDLPVFGQLEGVATIAAGSELRLAGYQSDFVIPTAFTSAGPGTFIVDNGILDIAAGATGTFERLELRNGPNVEGTGTILATATARLNGRFLHAGTMNLAPSCVTQINSNMLEFQQAYTLNNHGVCVWATPSIAIAAGATLNNRPGGVLEIVGTEGIGGYGFSGDGVVTNAGLVRKSAGGRTQIGVPFINSGRVELVAGAMAFTRFTQVSGETVLMGGEIDADYQIEPLRFDGGYLRGNGNVRGPLVNSGGVVAPGSSAGVITLSGAFYGNSYTQTAGGTLEIEIGGPTPGTEYDQLVIVSDHGFLDDVTLGGTLRVVLINGFNPTFGTFDVLIRQGPGTNFGTFATIDAPPGFDVTYLADRVRLTLVGSPSCDGDVNCDFALDGFDVETQEKAVGGDTTDYCQPDPDFNGDFALDGFDVEAVELVVGGGPCP